MADGESPPFPSPPPLGAPDHASSGEEDNSPRHVPLATKAAQPRTHNKDHSEKLAGAAGNAPELLPTWMSFEEKALAQGIQLMDLQRSATFEPPKLSPPPAAAQPAFSFSVLETDSDRPRPKPLTNAKKSPDKRHKNPPLKGEERMKTLYERKWESYNAILATTKLNAESGAPDAPLAIAAPAAAAPAVAAPDTEDGNAKPNKGRRNPKFPPVPGAANGVQPVVQLPPMPKAAPLAFSLQAQALAPRIDVVRPQLAAGGAVEMAGDEPSVSLAFCPEPELRISQLPYNIRTLTLTGVNLPVMPQQLFNLTALTRLNYSMNEMKDVPSDIGRLTNLVHLDLSDNKLASLPPNIGALVKIQRLFLHQNHFIALPSSIGRLRSLVQFYLHSNALTTLPQETGSLTKLEELLLQENHLKELPTSLGQLSKLRLLNISYNSDLTRLPQSLGRLHGVLTNLICDSVPLDKRPPDLKWLAQQPPEVSVGASTYAADLATLVNRNDFSDLKIHCDGPVVLAHRAIVSARAARVALPATAGEPLSKQVSTPDVATVAVRLPQADVVALLNYVYGANLPALKHHPEYMAPTEATSDAPAAASPPTPATAVGALAEDLRALLASGAFSDLTLRAEGVDFRVHKAILSCRCSYWANLFASGMKESREAVLPVEDLSAAGLRVVLTYLYTDNCTLDGDIAVEILQAADRYQLRRLTEMVECFLAESLEVDNMLDLWELSDSYHAEQLNRRCLHQLASGNKWSLVRKTEAYARLETNAPLKQKLMKALSTQPILFI